MPKKVVIIGGGFGGMNVAKSLRGTDYQITIIDKSNHHLFQPLLYQVATAALSPGDIAVPIRSVFSSQKNVSVILGEVVAVSKEDQVFNWLKVMLSRLITSLLRLGLNTTISEMMIGSLLH